MTPFKDNVKTHHTVHKILSNIVKDENKSIADITSVVSDYFKVDKNEVVNKLLGDVQSYYCEECKRPFNAGRVDAVCPACKSDANMVQMTPEILATVLHGLRSRILEVEAAEASQPQQDETTVIVDINDVNYEELLMAA